MTKQEKTVKEQIQDSYGEKLWKMTEYFYSASAIFQEMYYYYEERVLAFAEDRKVDRKKLRLSAEELSTLFDLVAMEKLRDEVLFHLKDITHALFRSEDSTDELDRYCSDIFHEMSILKEEHYTVKTYASDYQDREAAGKILDEVHESFPLKLNQVRLLFERARQRTEEILLRENTSRILVRSLYLYGEELLLPIYPDGLMGLYRIMYPGGGSAEGFLSAAKSFFESNFYEKAAEAIQKAEKRLDASGIPEKNKKKLRSEINYLSSRLEPFKADYNRKTK